MTEQIQGVLYTIGHSNHTIEDFIGLLKRHGVTTIADVRSAPYSRYCPQFNREVLAAVLGRSGMAYLYLGRELGARPEDSSCYEKGHANFAALAHRGAFKQALEGILRDAQRQTIALMCSEKDPIECHRMILVCRNLRRPGVDIRHILEDGSVEEHLDAERRLVRALEIGPDLFEQDLTERDAIERAYDRQAEKIAYDASTWQEIP